MSARAWVDTQREEFENLLARLVSHRSVSADPKARDACIACGKDAVEILRARLGAEAELIPSPLGGLPAVVARLHRHPGRPTVLLYNHLDVQPADPKGWEIADPFKMECRGMRYVGRGTTDDKGPALAAMLAVAFASEVADIPLNFTFVWELEEESGSPSFDAFVAKHAALLKADSILVSDTVWLSSRRPAIAAGLRGLAGCLLTLETGQQDVHSGLAGGPARNPIGELADVIARLYDARTGRVHVAGFYDDVKEPTPEELEALYKSGFSVEGFKQAHKLVKMRTEDHRQVIQAIMVRPTFEVHNIAGGDADFGRIKSVIPQKAEAKISCRLVANQSPASILKRIAAAVKAINPDVEVTEKLKIEPFLADVRSKHFQYAKEALRAAFPDPDYDEPTFVREGGSIGAMVTLAKRISTNVVMMGMSLPTHGYHSVNEHFDWMQAAGGAHAFIEYFDRIARVS